MRLLTLSIAVLAGFALAPAAAGQNGAAARHANAKAKQSAFAQKSFKADVAIKRFMAWHRSEQIQQANRSAKQQLAALKKAPRVMAAIRADLQSRWSAPATGAPRGVKAEAGAKAQADGAPRGVAKPRATAPVKAKAKANASPRAPRAAAGPR